MENLKIYNQHRAVPETAKKEIVAGRMKGKTDINPMWRIKALTELFGPCGIGWYYTVSKKWTEVYGDEVAAFVDIELFVKHEDKWSMPICGTGGSMFVAKESRGPYVSDECYKMATTDAISVACKQLGIGADVYWEKDKSKYDNVPEQDEPKNAITTNEANVLRSLVAKKGLDPDKLFNIPIEKLSPEQYVKALENINKMRDKKVS
jgi:hypothetical protein